MHIFCSCITCDTSTIAQSFQHKFNNASNIQTKRPRGLDQKEQLISHLYTENIIDKHTMKTSGLIYREYLVIGTVVVDPCCMTSKTLHGSNMSEGFFFDHCLR